MGGQTVDQLTRKYQISMSEYEHERAAALQGRNRDEQGTASEMTISGDGSESEAQTDAQSRPFTNKVHERASLLAASLREDPARPRRRRCSRVALFKSVVPCLLARSRREAQ
jgi:hypothetical protein